MSIIVPDFILDVFKKERFHGDLDSWIMYIDLTGFTPLTASLLQDAGAGAEEVSDLLNDVFSPLVDIVYQHGGFIPHFAGDAFFAIFPKSTTDIYVFTVAVKKVHAHFRTKNAKNRSHEERPMAILDIYFCPKGKNRMTFWTEKIVIF